ncbi:MAG: ABC transporter substrate-binding protein [Minisyncoccia bacterium]
MTLRQKRIIFFIVGIIVVLIFLSIIYSKKNGAVNLTMWGFYNSPEDIDSIISIFQNKYPNINIQYVQKDPQSYYNDLIIAFANNKAPDIFMLPGNWVPTFQNKILPLNLNKDRDINLKFIENNYPKIVKSDLVFDNNLYGIPISLDTLVLYYNKDIFYQEKIPLPPQNWDEFLNLISRLRKIDNRGNVLRAAVALGTYDNIQWANDILASLIIQYGSSITDPVLKRATFSKEINLNGKTIIPGVEALKSYTQFADKKSQYYTWSNESFNNIFAFTQGKVAMIISYNLIQQELQRKNINYGIAPFPLIDVNNPKYYGRTINLAVSKYSKFPQESWLFLKLWSNPEVEEYYTKQTKNVPTLNILIQKISQDPLLGVFANQIPNSYSWYQFNFKEIVGIFSKMINDIVVANLDYNTVIKEANNRLDILWQKQKYIK